MKLYRSCLVLISTFSTLFAFECANVYNVNGCEEVFFDLGDEMSISQYKVIYDSDQDRVSDKLDKCPDTPLRVDVDKYGCKIPKVYTAKSALPKSIKTKKEDKVLEAVKETLVVQVMTLKINFARNRAEVLKDYESVVKEFAVFLKSNPEYKAEIVGHTDSRGDYTTNLELSKSRSNVVMEMLISFGVKADRLSTDGVGSSTPVATNSTIAGRAKNRRIEVTLTKEAL